MTFYTDFFSSSQQGKYGIGSGSNKMFELVAE